ncbi:hypothetical protein ACWCQM_34270 [Streptomyces sp. NPDC002125]
MQLVRLFTEESHEVAQQIELGHGQVVAEAECPGCFHEPQMQFRLRPGQHDAQSWAPGDQVVGSGLQASGD